MSTARTVQISIALCSKCNHFPPQTAQSIINKKCKLLFQICFLRLACLVTMILTPNWEIVDMYCLWDSRLSWRLQVYSVLYSSRASLQPLQFQIVLSTETLNHNVSYDNQKVFAIRLARISKLKLVPNCSRMVFQHFNSNRKIRNKIDQLNQID